MNESIVSRSDPQFAPLNSPSTALESARLIKPTPGVLYGMVVKNTGPAQFMQIHDVNSLAALPGSVPIVSADLPAGATVTVDFGVFGAGCVLGIAVANSATALNRTAGAADCLFYPRYK